MQPTRRAFDIVYPAHRWIQLCLLFGWLLVGVVSLFIALSSLQELPLVEKLLGYLEAYVASEKAKYSPLPTSVYYCRAPHYSPISWSA